MGIPARKKIKIKPRFVVILLVFFAILGVAVFLLLGGAGEGEMVMGTAQLEYTAKTVVLRDELVVNTERYGKILFNVVEGAYVSEGDQIAQIFRWGYQEETMNTLLEVQEKIYDYLIGLWSEVVNPDIDAIQQQIRQKQTEIRDAVQGKSDRDMLLLEQELRALLLSRNEILRNVQPDETLLAYYDQENAQMSNLAIWKSDMVNDVGSGVVSFYFDGNEQALSLEKMGMLNADIISSILNGSGAVTSVDTTVESPLYRLVDNMHFYLVFITDTASAFRLVEGEGYTVTFKGHADKLYTGAALAPIVAEKQVVNILEFHQDVGDLMGMRVVEATVAKAVTGLRVPKSAIHLRDNDPGVLRVSGDDTQWVEVNVLAEDDGDFIIQSADANAALGEGMRYKKP
ncbi:MAG: hypothetical protein LBS18_02500 [Clostridiales bacterium]|nr:hypothetical protein [Clostridiales bacterium]